MTPLFAASIYWDLPVLLAVFSLVYSATRHDRWSRILWEAAGWVVRVGGFLLTIGVVLYVLSSYPDYWPYTTAGLAVLFAAYWWVTGRLAKPKPADKPAGT